MKLFEKIFGSKEEKKEIESQKPDAEAGERMKSATPQEQILERREKTSSRHLGGGANETIFVELKDDGSAVFKPSNGEVLLRESTEAGTYYKRERAAYLVNRFLNFDLVPSTVIRELDGEVGSVQEFIPDAKAGARLSIEECNTPNISTEFLKLWIFDYVIWNSDRSWFNFLVKQNKLYAIDNGLSFADEIPRFAGEDWPFSEQKFFDAPLAPEISENFKEFFSWTQGKEILRGLLGELLAKNEVDACLARIEKIGKIIEERGMIPLAERGKLTF